MNFESVEKIAAAILYEGYILYPYRKTAIKNRQRWNFGTLYPRVYGEAQRPEEPWRLIAECLIESGGEDATLDLKLQFLQLQSASSPGPGTPSFPHLGKGGYAQDPLSPAAQELTDPSLAWEEALECKSELANLQLKNLINQPLNQTLTLNPTDPNIRPPHDLKPQITITTQLVPSGALKLRIELQNNTLLPSGAEATRKEALPKSLVSAHLLLGNTGAEFISLLDPSPAYAADAAACNNVGVFPVLAGEEPDRTIILCSPIILYDYPKIAPESEGDFFDGTEMDEMLTLRVLTLTDSEKEEMRYGDPRARRILERTESLTGEEMLKAHGVVRSMREVHEEA